MRDHLLRFMQNLFYRKRLLSASDLRDDAKGAFIVASFGYLQIFIFLIDVGIHSRRCREIKISEMLAVVSLHKILDAHRIHIAPRKAEKVSRVRKARKVFFLFPLLSLYTFQSFIILHCTPHKIHYLPCFQKLVYSRFRFFSC